MWADRVRVLHFVGIGGAGMSGIAEVLAANGHTITGSDLVRSEATEHLEELGIRVIEGHAAENVGVADVVVISSAVGPSNPEVMAARERGIAVIRRAEMLGELMRMKFSVGIGGSHGKTSTTSMVGHVLQHAGLDPTIIVGGRLIALDANARSGAGRYLVAEADEYDRSFLDMRPVVAVATNLECDHLDCYEDLADLQRAFGQFLGSVPFYGTAIVNAESPPLAELAGGLRRPCKTFGMARDATYRAVDVETRARGGSFRLTIDGVDAGRVTVKLPGRYNLLNALCACAVCDDLGVDFATIASGLESFGGVGRRFEVVGTTGDVTVVDDYAHHPTEVACALEAGRDWLEGRGRLWAIFQPHLFSRTQQFFREFAEALSSADEVILLSIYPARERPTGDVTSALIAQDMRERFGKAAPVEEDFDRVAALVAERAESGDLVMTIGAGTVTHLAPKIVTRLEPSEVRS